MKIMGRRERKKLQSRNKILQAAVRCFTAKGVQDTPVAEIMEAADLGTGTFYNYFSSKEDVLMCLLAGLVEQLQTVIQQLLQEHHSQTEILEAAVMETARLLLENRFVLPLFLSAAEAAGEPIGRDKSLSAPAFRSVFSEIIRQGQAAGEFRQDIPADVVTEMFHSVFQAASFSHLKFSFTENVQLKVRLILGGLAVQPVRSRRNGVKR